MTRSEAPIAPVAQPKQQWLRWADVPQNVHEVAAQGPWFLEIFAGTARLTDAVRQMGIPCLPPIDVMISQHVQDPFDVLDADRWTFIMQLVQMGAIFFVHCGTPCNTFSAARKADGGPPPLRSPACPEGLPALSGSNWFLAQIGNLFVDRTVEVCLGVAEMGGDFSIENPEKSLIWSTRGIQRLLRCARAWLIHFDQCAWGAPSMKPTSLCVTHAAFSPLHRRCPGHHAHEVLQGQVYSEFFGKVVYRTKLAQEYPHLLCAAMAEAISAIRVRPLHLMEASFGLLSTGKRKRMLGQAMPWEGHRQHLTAQLAAAAGYQLKRGAMKPLLEVESEPGQAILWAMSIDHPFSTEIAVEPGLQAALQQFAYSSEHILQRRSALLHKCGAIAQSSLEATDQILRRIPDAPLRHLLRGVPDHEPAQLGVTCHLVLYKLLLAAINSVDQDLPHCLLSGFPIVGPILRSGRWPPYEKAQSPVAVTLMQSRAWEIRKKIIAHVQAVPITENLKKIWDATVEDVHEGSCIGPVFDQKDVSFLVGRDDWIPTQRFEVVQKNKVRGCDSATTNLINQATVITEKLQLPSTDSNVAALRKLRAMCPGSELAGWVLDERKAYRQVPIRPDHRMFSVIALKEPASGKTAFFVMIGHSFGLVSAVYNYNRRSAAINEILVSLFGLIAFSFYDDKYGFEPAQTVESAHQIAQHVHWWLGAKFDRKKLQLSRAPTILGVTYNLDDFVLEIKDDRKSDLIEEIDHILHSGLLDPGTAGKLKGKLMFGASQLWGKVGRAFLRVISERQYARFPFGDSGFALDEPLRFALEHWRHLIRAGPPRPIEMKKIKKPDVVIFTDGFTPDPRDDDPRPDRVGAVLFDRRWEAPLQFSEVIPKEMQKNWAPRKTQIVPVEMIAPILALHTFRERLFGTDLILLIDSEAVESALVKGYSSKSDLCTLVSVFWNLIFELRVRVFIDRVSTDFNPADWPSRDDLSTGEKAGWKTVQACWPGELLSFDR